MIFYIINNLVCIREKVRILRKMFGHWPLLDKNKSRSRCKKAACDGFTHIFCSTCGSHYCLTSTRNCFAFHDQHQQQSQRRPKQNEQKQKPLKNLNINVPRRPICNRKTNLLSASSNLDAPTVGSSGFKRKSPVDSEAGSISNDGSVNGSSFANVPARTAKYNTRDSSSFVGTFSGSKE